MIIGFEGMSLSLNFNQSGSRGLLTVHTCNNSYKNDVMKRINYWLKLDYGKFLSSRFIMILLFLCTGLIPATSQIKIYINTDLEGISGVYKFDQAWVKDTP